MLTIRLCDFGLSCKNVPVEAILMRLDALDVCPMGARKRKNRNSHVNVFFSCLFIFNLFVLLYRAAIAILYYEYSARRTFVETPKILVNWNVFSRNSIEYQFKQIFTRISHHFSREFHLIHEWIYIRVAQFDNVARKQRRIPKIRLAEYSVVQECVYIILSGHISIKLLNRIFGLLFMFFIVLNIECVPCAVIW